MKPGDVYREAARRLCTIGSDGRLLNCCCCEAISSAALERDAPCMDLETNFGLMFKPEAARVYWWDGGCICDAPDTETPRVLALLFMHWMTVDP